MGVKEINRVIKRLNNLLVRQDIREWLERLRKQKGGQIPRMYRNDWRWTAFSYRFSPQFQTLVLKAAIEKFKSKKKRLRKPRRPSKNAKFGRGI